MEQNKREIKFRVWNLDRKEWAEYGVLDMNGSFKQEGVGYHEYNYVIQLFTGLLDKNGKEIYEGDILLGRFVLDEVEDHIFLSLTEEEKETQSKVFVVNDIFYPYTNQIPEDLEAIGNIYENPNLLSEK
jgi:hypothetical protein